MIINKIGTRVYAVHKHYTTGKLQGGRIKICRIKTYANQAGKIMPVLAIVGQKEEIDNSTHCLHYTLVAAIEAIKTK